MIPMVPVNNKKRFHGIPWNWHQQFHGIPWNLECANFADTSSSMEFHGTKRAPISLIAPISLTQAVPWNSMEFHGTARVSEIGATQDQWNSMELRVCQFRWHEQFHGIPWNLKCANFADMRSSMEFHGTLGVPISLPRSVPWNSMELGVRQFRWHEQFHGIPWNSMELWVHQFRWHEQFHGIPWNFDDMSSSMEFHGTLGAPISLTRAVPWNSMESHGT